MPADPAIIGGQAGTILGVVLVLLAIAVGSIAAFIALDARFDAKLIRHEEREGKKSDERHKELKDLIEALNGRIDKLYERGSPS